MGGRWLTFGSTSSFFFCPRVSAVSLQWSCCHHAFFAFCRRFLADGLVARSSTSSARRGGRYKQIRCITNSYTIRDEHIALVTRLHNSIDDMPFI